MKNKKVNKYYSLVKTGNEADINIFGDITSYDGWFSSESDVSAYKLSKQLEELQDVETINVHISSYGGEVKEGLAIYNSLKNHKAKIRTYCDGFACSIASVIFMAGDERIMSKASLLMIHNAWVYASGNAEALRKQADDLDKITQASVNAYMEHVNITEEELKSLMDNETWLTYNECLEMGFVTSMSSENESDKASQSVKNKLINLILQAQKFEEDDEDDENTNDVDSPDTNGDETDDGEDPKKDDEEVTEAVDDEEEEPNTETDEGTDEEEKENKEEKEVTNEKMVAFFNAILK